MSAPAGSDAPVTGAGSAPGRRAGVPTPEHGEPLATDGLLPVHELVAAVARSAPDATAVESGGRALFYGELMGQAERIASSLHAAGAGPGSRIALLTEPSVAMVAAALGILRAGAAYVPIDLAYPDARIEAVLSDSGAAAAVAGEAGRRRLGRTTLPVIPAEGGGEAAGAAPAAVTAADPAYVIYTSGSTGRPKGVVVTHGQLAASTAARRLVYPAPPAFLLLSPLAFDSSVAGLWGTLTAGGRLVAAGADDVADPERLVALVDDHQVTMLLCVPSLYQVLVDAAERLGEHRLRSLRTVIVAGEALPEMLVKRHFATLAGVELVNEYGPTEATVWASYHRFDAPREVTIGRPVPGTRLYVLDDEFRRLEDGAGGELFIAGANVSAGYLGQPAETAAAFLPDPFGADGGRMYRTGDHARWNEDGTLDFLGRRDHQVKIRGHRVELGAVEAALREAPGVREAVVVPDSECTRLTAFVTAGPGVDPAALRSQLAAELPAVMVPAGVRVVDELPRTVGGKVDRARLGEIADARPLASNGNGPAPAPGGLGAQVAAAWAEVLQVADVPADVNFFDLGGHSLAMFRLQDALERRTGRRPSVVSLFRHTTVEAQAALIEGEGEDPGLGDTPSRAESARRARAMRTRRARVARQAAAPPTGAAWLQCAVPRPTARSRLVCFPHAGGSASFFRDWGQHLAGVEVHAVAYPGRGERIDEPPATDLRPLAAAIAEAIAAQLGAGPAPVSLFGHSMGAAVAFETACALEDRGMAVAHLFASGSRDAPLPEPLASEEPEDAAAVAGRLVDLGGTDPELAADPMFQELVLPYVRADTRMFHAYRPEPGVALRCPVTTIVGDRDDDADRRPWRELTTGTVREEVVSGDHFYLVEAPPFGLVEATLG